jgi:hypothetical protein
MLSPRSSRVAAERLVYAKLDASLDFVGATRVDSAGALTWLSVAGDDSGRISCTSSSTARFDCSWQAKLIQSYTGTVRVTYRGHASHLAFTRSTCKNPSAKGVSYPDLCAIDPVPGMPNY